MHNEERPESHLETNDPSRSVGAGWPTRALLRLRRNIWEPPDSNLAPLDGLRGIASCMVVFYHCALFMAFYSPQAIESGRGAWVRAISNGFWSGIDIFFVLSGFLIGRILIVNLSRDGVLYYWAFIVRRSFRIFPAYYLVTTLSLFVIAPLDLPVFAYLFRTRDWGELARGSWANYFYLVNYVNPGNEPSVLSWAWSLAVEEHFYLILPPILWLLFRFRSDAVRIGGLVACVALPFLGRAFQYWSDPTIEMLDGFYYYSHNRFDEIFVGVVIAYFYVMHYEALRRFCERAGSALGLVGLSCVAAVWIFGGLTQKGAFSLVFQLIVMATGTGLVLLNGLFLDNRLTRFFANPRWYPLARISYGTYLVHPFVLFGLIHFYRVWISTADFGVTELILFYVVVMGLSSLVAAALFELLELPMLHWGARLSRASKQRMRQRSHSEAS